jgi:intracellular sulfur oxidation DsrE/DsrF family protein
MKTKLIPALLLALAAIPALAADKLNVVYHVSEAEKVAFVLGNIQNHIDGVGGPENVHIVMVAHGPAINAFNDIEATDRVRTSLAKLNEEGVELAMCGNTLKGFGLALDELLPGFVEVPEGGVTKIAELQSQGYIYIRP